MTITLKACNTCACPEGDCGTLTGSPMTGFVWISGGDLNTCGSVLPPIGGAIMSVYVTPTDATLQSVTIGPQTFTSVQCTNITANIPCLGVARQWVVLRSGAVTPQCTAGAVSGTDVNAITLPSDFQCGNPCDQAPFICIGCTRNCATDGVEDTFTPTIPAPVQVDVTLPVGTDWYYMVVTYSSSETQIISGCGVVGNECFSSPQVLNVTSCVLDITGITIRTESGGVMFAESVAVC
jgi:hypothetical protein